VPRVSADALTVVPAARTEFPPPAHLGAAESAIFRDVLASADKNHFRPEDRELLALYCTHVAAARRLMARKRRTREQQHDLRAETAIVVTLSTKLRLGPKSRAPDNRRAASSGLRGFAVAALATSPPQPGEPSQEPIERRWTTTRDPAAREEAGT
jgi:hypothetical protein